MSYKKKLINGEALLKVAKGLKEKIQSENIDVSRLEGVIDLENLPKGAVERLYVVENDWGRFSLTKEQVQNGDTVKVNSTQKMYFVVDDTKLNLSSGYTEYTVGKATAVDWNGVENKPTEFTPKAHTQGSDTITDMVGYETKNADYISSSDTLNQAIGKLEGTLQIKQNLRDSELKTSDKSIVGAINENKREISTKEDSFSKNSAFNKPFGVTKNTVLEGSNFGKLENKINLKQNKVDSSLKTNNKNIVDAINEVKTEVGTKESKFSKNSAFNKSFGTSSNTVLEGNRYGELVSKINSGDNRLQSNINSKEDKFIKNSAFNKNFGTSDNTVLEGSKYNDLEGKINDSETRLNSKINTKEPSFVKQSAFNKPFGTSKGTVLEGEIYKIIEKNKEQTSQLQTTKQDKIDNNLKTLTTKNIVEILNGNQGNYQGMNIMDCNTPVVPGFYHVHKTAKNNPIKDWTVLQITCEVGASGSRRETVYSILDPRIQYVRSYVNGKYSNWEKIPSQQEINSLETKKQNKTDNSLKTSNKNVVGAINENKSNIDTKVDKTNAEIISTDNALKVNSGDDSSAVYMSFWNNDKRLGYLGNLSSGMDDIAFGNDMARKELRIKADGRLLYDGAEVHTDDNVDLSTKQNKRDSSLETNDKTVVGAINEVKAEVDTKESKFSKNSAFNKSFGTSSNTVLEGNRYGELVSKINSGDNRLQSNINSKEDKFIKNSAFNKNFGTSNNTVMEGSKYNILEGKINDSESRLNSKINTKEPSFVKQSAFNKPFGTSVNTVLEGNNLGIINKSINVKQDKTDNSLNTSSKDVVGAINELTKGKMTRRSYGDNEVDLNTLSTTMIGSGDNFRNNPNGSISTFIHMYYSQDWQSQIFSTPNSNNPWYVRSRYNGTTWTDWHKLFHTGNFNPNTKLNTTSSSLQTNTKEVISAINELKQRIDELTKLTNKQYTRIGVERNESSSSSTQKEI